MTDTRLTKIGPHSAGEVQFICEGCGIHVRTFRWVNYRTIPPSMDERNLCATCKERLVDNDAA